MLGEVCTLLVTNGVESKLLSQVSRALHGPYRSFFPFPHSCLFHFTHSRQFRDFSHRPLGSHPKVSLSYFCLPKILLFFHGPARSFL